MEIKIKEASNNSYEIVKTKELLEITFKKKFNIEYLNWLYKENPSGDAITYNAWHNNNIVAHYTVVPMKFKYNTSSGICALTLNTATHPSYTGKGLFQKLANLTYEKATREQCSFIYGVANSQSTWVFENKLGFQNYGPLYVKFGFGDLNRSVKDDSKISINWNTEILKWRLNRPGSNYNITKSQNNIKIWKKFFLFKILMYEFEDKIKFQNKQLNNNKFYRPISVYIGNDSSRTKNNLFYFDFPKIFKPSPLNLIFKKLNNKDQDYETNPMVIEPLGFDIF